MNVLGSALVLLLAAAPPSFAVGGPPRSPEESSLLGPGEGFELRGSRLVRKADAERAELFHPNEGADSLQRLVLDGGKGLDLELFFSARPVLGSAPEGLGLRLKDDQITLVRHHAGQETTIVYEPIRLKRRQRLEVIALVQGGELLVEIFDPKRRAYLRALQGKLSFAVRGVGLIASKKHAPSRAVRSWTRRPACLKSWPKSKRGRARYLRLDEATAEAARRVVGRGRFKAKEALGDGRSVYRSDLEGIARLRCAGIQVGPVAIETPWKYMDPAYMRARTKSPQPTRRGFRVDLSYKNPAMSNALLKAYANRFGELARYVEIGKSHQGRAMGALVIGRKDKAGRPKPAVFINGAHHGNEPMSVEFVFDTIQRLLERSGSPKIRRWLDTFEIWAVPIINPDGAWAFLEETWRTGRKNGRDIDGDGRRGRLEGVDLNRNYPFKWGALGEKGSKSDPRSPWYRGSAPGLEPEVEAVMRLANQERFAASLSYHTGTVKVLAPYTIDGAQNPRPHLAWKVGARLLEGLEDHPQGKEWVLARNLYSVDGTDQDWLFHQNGTLAFLVEGARRSPRNREERRAVVANVRPITDALLERIRKGPAVHGQILDRDGKPVMAEVRVAGTRLREGEIWRSRCRDGHFTRVLSHAGPTVLTVLVPGHPPFKKKVRPKRGLTRVDIRLDVPVKGDPCPKAIGR